MWVWKILDTVSELSSAKEGARLYFRRLAVQFKGKMARGRILETVEYFFLASAPLHTQDTEIGLGALV